MTPLDVAMRDWAGSNPTARRSVRAADEALLKFVADAFTELGHDRREARLRAIALMSVGVARLHSPWKVPKSQAERLLAMLVSLD